MELTIIEPKNPNVPFRALPEETLNMQIAFFCQWLELLLGLKATQENEKRLKFLMTQIKDTAWGLSVIQMKEAFQMYVDGKLSDNGKPLEVISGFVDTVHFKKVIRAYKNEKGPKIDHRQIALATYSHFKEQGTLMKGVEKFSKPIKGVVETFDYLYEKGLLPKRDGEFEAHYNNKMKVAQAYLYAPLFDKRKWFESEGLTGVPEHKRLVEEMESIKNQEHKDLLPKFKQLVLEGYFKKLKNPLDKIL
jgi:hypothetical protein